MASRLQALQALRFIADSIERFIADEERQLQKLVRPVLNLANYHLELHKLNRFNKYKATESGNGMPVFISEEAAKPEPRVLTVRESETLDKAWNQLVSVDGEGQTCRREVISMWLQWTGRTRTAKDVNNRLAKFLEVLREWERQGPANIARTIAKNTREADAERLKTTIAKAACFGKLCESRKDVVVLARSTVARLSVLAKLISSSNGGTDSSGKPTSNSLPTTESNPETMLRGEKVKRRRVRVRELSIWASWPTSGVSWMRCRHLLKFIFKNKICSYPFR